VIAARLYRNLSATFIPTRKIEHTVASIIIFSSVTLNANAQVPADTLTEKKSAIRTKLTIRIHSMGMFSYSGRIVSNNPSCDVNFTWERKNIGITMLKAANFYDLRARNNFSLFLVYRNIHIRQALTITPNIGFIADQQYKIVGRGSDAIAILTTSIKLNMHLTFDNSMIFSDLIVQRETIDWVNRFRLLYSKDHLDLTLSMWHNNNIFDCSHYLSTGLSMVYSHIKVNEKIYLNTGITGMMMIETSDQESFPKKNGLVFTVATVF
jgi:hypothetical protein